MTDSNSIDRTIDDRFHDIELCDRSLQYYLDDPAVQQALRYEQREIADLVSIAETHNYTSITGRVLVLFS